MSKRSRISRFAATATAGLSLAVLTACATGYAEAGTPSPGPSGNTSLNPSANISNRTKIEYEIPSCMKQKGFRYVPELPPPATSERLRAISGDLSAMKRFREKYGLGIFSWYVYPDEYKRYFGLFWNSPNNKIADALSETQRKSYEAAWDACLTQASRKILKRDIKSAYDLMKQYEVARSSAINALDAEFAESAKTFRSRLREKGYRVGSLKPSELEHGYLHAEYNKEHDRLTKNSTITLSADQARPFLKREIKAALDDLECGKDFYPAYLSKFTEVNRRVAEEYGFSAL